MNSLFALLFIFSLILLIAGVIKPSLLHRKEIDKQRLTRKKIALGFGILALVFFILTGITAPKVQDQRTNNSAPPIKVQESTTKQASNTSQKTTLDKLWEALDMSVKTRDHFDIQYDESNKKVTISNTNATFWDETSMVRGGYSNLVRFGIEAFNIEGVDSIQSIVKQEFTNSYGKKSMEDAVRVSMDKEEFKKFDWKNLNNQSVYKQIENSTSEHYIHPAVRKNVDFSKLYISI